VYAGSSTPYKDWGRERFRELVERLVRERNADVVLVGGRGDRRDADWICAQAADHVTALAGRLNLRESAAVLRRSAAFIGGDSGLGHVAVALGIPTVLLFGPSDWRKWAREHGRHAVVRQPTACAPCFIFGYHRLCRSRLCMQRITVEDVLDAFDRVVAT
jgi:ADP-heptose:LPS heptosyltransferase